MAGVTPYTENSWKKTNADRIRAMTDEELAQLFAGYVLNITDGRQLNDATVLYSIG